MTTETCNPHAPCLRLDGVGGHGSAAASDTTDAGQPLFYAFIRSRSRSQPARGQCTPPAPEAGLCGRPLTPILGEWTMLINRQLVFCTSLLQCPLVYLVTALNIGAPISDGLG